MVLWLEINGPLLPKLPRSEIFTLPKVRSKNCAISDMQVISWNLRAERRSLPMVGPCVSDYLMALTCTEKTSDIHKDLR